MIDKHEKTFFKACYRLNCVSMWTIKEVIDLLSDTITKNECWTYLRKWRDIGFYIYGSAIDLGRIDKHLLPKEYLEIMYETY